MRDQECQRAPHAILHRHAAELVAFAELRGQQHGKRGLVELDTRPVGLATEPLVLVPVAVVVLRGNQIAEHRAGFFNPAQRQQRLRRFDQIARPHEVIAAAFFAPVAPGDRQAGDHGPEGGLVAVGFDDLRRPDPLLAQVVGQIRRRLDRTAAGVPAQPGGLLHGAMRFERLGERGARERGGGLLGGGKAQCQRGMGREPAHERHIARPGGFKLPGHAAVCRKILPAVRRAHVAGRAVYEGIRAVRRVRHQRQPERALLRPQHTVAAILRGPRAIVFSGAAQVRSQQRVNRQIRLAFQRHVDEQHIARGIGAHAQGQRKTRMTMRDHRQRYTRRRHHDVDIAQTFDLDPEARAVAHDEPQIAHLRNIDAGKIHLVDDAVPEREPDPRRPQRSADQVLVAGRPGGRNAGRAKGV